jgi:hypothetical protein
MLNLTWHLSNNREVIEVISIILQISVFSVVIKLKTKIATLSETFQNLISNS